MAKHGPRLGVAGPTGNMYGNHRGVNVPEDAAVVPALMACDGWWPPA